MTAGGINTRLLLWLQLRCTAAALAVSVGGWLLFAAAARLLLPWWPLVLVATAAAEGCFYVVWKRKHAELDSIPEAHAPEDHDGWAFFERWFASHHYNVKFLAIAELIKCWFNNTPAMEIRRDNTAELVARGYFYKTLDQLRVEGKAHLVEQMLLAMEAVWGYRFEEGLNPALQYLDHLQEPLKVSYRPLGFYLGCEAAAGFKHALLLAAGFSAHTQGAYTYYTRGLPSEAQAAQGHTPASEPLVFLHGVGAGLLPYIPFLLRLTSLGQPVLAAEYRHLSMRWTDFIPTAPQVASDMSRMFERHGVSTVSLVAHSYGSFYASCLLKLARDKVSSVALIDPVCCCMWSGHLISNFVYSPARSTTGLITWLISRDIHTATSVARNFFWTDVNLWPDEIPPNSLFVLSDKDDLVPVQHVEWMLHHDAPHSTVLRLPGAHADFLLSPTTQDNIVQAVGQMLQRQSVSSPAADQHARASGELSAPPSSEWVVVTPSSSSDSSSSGSRRRRRASEALSDAAAAAAEEDAACFKDAVAALRYGMQSKAAGSGSDQDSKAQLMAGDQTSAAASAAAPRRKVSLKKRLLERLRRQSGEGRDASAAALVH